MNKRNFLKSALALCGVPFIGMGKTEAKENPPVYSPNRIKLSHHYPDAYHEPNDLFTPEEIEEAGFVFVGFPTFIHDFSNPQKPIMQSYVNWSGNDPQFPLPNENYLPVVCRSKMMSPTYIKTYDIDAGRRRGIESVRDYFRKKEIFKPMILEFMRKHEYHYVYRGLLGDSPCIWRQRMEGFDRDSDFYLYPVFIRGSKLPKRNVV